MDINNYRIIQVAPDGSPDFFSVSSSCSSEIINFRAFDLVSDKGT